MTDTPTPTRKRRLGRGLEALLGTIPDSSPESTTESRELETPEVESPTIIPMDRGEQLDTDSFKDEPVATPYASNPAIGSPSDASSLDNELEKLTGSGPGIVQLNVYEIDDNPFQPRRDFSEPEIVSLAESLKEHDMLQPILVRRVNNRYQLISGERRLRASIQAGWSTVPARIREADDKLVAELAIVENLQRKDLNPLEKSLSFRRYLEEHNATQEELANRLKIDRSTIANLLRLLDLPPVVQDALRSEVISQGHARALLPLDEETKQIEYCNRITREGWSVRDTEKNVRNELNRDEPAKTKRKKSKNDQIQSLESELRLALGTKVEIKQSARRRGQIVVHFNNQAEFERLKESMCEDRRRAS